MNWDFSDKRTKTSHIYPIHGFTAIHLITIIIKEGKIRVDVYVLVCRTNRLLSWRFLLSIGERSKLFLTHAMSKNKHPLSWTDRLNSVIS